MDHDAKKQGAITLDPFRGRRLAGADGPRLVRGRSLAPLKQAMTRDQSLLRHFLAAIAYRTAKALRDAPPAFGSFDAGHHARTPRELVRHMSGVINYAVGTLQEPRPVLADGATYEAEIDRLFALLRELSDAIGRASDLGDAIAERLLQGPLSDAMTHAGQLALLRRLSGSPLPPENFFDAAIDPDRLGMDQAAPVSPDEVWPQAPKGWIPPGRR